MTHDRVLQRVRKLWSRLDWLGVAISFCVKERFNSDLARLWYLQRHHTHIAGVLFFVCLFSAWTKIHSCFISFKITSTNKHLLILINGTPKVPWLLKKLQLLLLDNFNAFNFINLYRSFQNIATKCLTEHPKKWDIPLYLCSDITSAF